MSISYSGWLHLPCKQEGKPHVGSNPTIGSINNKQIKSQIMESDKYDKHNP